MRGPARLTRRGMFPGRAARGSVSPRKVACRSQARLHALSAGPRPPTRAKSHGKGPGLLVRTRASRVLGAKGVRHSLAGRTRTSPTGVPRSSKGVYSLTRRSQRRFLQDQTTGCPKNDVSALVDMGQPVAARWLQDAALRRQGANNHEKRNRASPSPARSKHAWPIGVIYARAAHIKSAFCSYVGSASIDAADRRCDIRLVFLSMRHLHINGRVFVFF